MDHVFVVYPGRKTAVCQNCGKTEAKATKVCPGPSGSLPKSPPDLSEVAE